MPRSTPEQQPGPGLPPGVDAGQVLPFTGVSLVRWLFAAFALMVAGSLLMRPSPRRD